MKIKLLADREDFGKQGEVVEVNQYVYEYLKELGQAELVEEEKETKKQKNEKN